MTAATAMNHLCLSVQETPREVKFRRARYARMGRVFDREDTTMGNGLSLDQVEDRIAIVRDNIRQLIEQSAADSGAANEARNADRLAQQQAELETLTRQRENRK